MKRIITIVILFFLSIIAAFSQELVEGYYIMNSVMYTGVYLLKDNERERAKRVIIPQQAGREAKTFYPGDIQGYGFQNELIKYISAKITINEVEIRVFLEEILNIKDSLIFYIYRTEDDEDIFFVLGENGNKLRRLDSNSPEEVWNIFLNQNDCGNIQGLEDFPKKLTRKRFNVFYSAYKNCNPNLFPKFQFGLVTNLGIGRSVFYSGDDPYTTKFDLAFSVGGYFQLPFDEGMSLRTELLYSYLNNNIGENKNSQYIRQSIQVPLLARYTFNYKPWKTIPYMEAGPCFDYAFSGGKYIDGTLLEPFEGMLLDDVSIIKFQYGVSAGVGIEHKISHKRSLHLGLRYNWLFGSRQNREYEEKVQFLGINAAISL